MIPTVQHVTIEGVLHQFWEFPSLAGYHDFVDHQGKHLNGENQETWREFMPWVENQVVVDPEYMGTSHLASTQELDDLVLFSDTAVFSLLEGHLQNQIRELRQLATQRLVPQKQLQVNSRGLGVFSFPLAAKGLYLGYRKQYGSAMEIAISQMNMLLGNKVPKTTNRRAFLNFETTKQSRDAVDLFVVAGNNGSIDASSLVYSGLACTVVAELLETCKVPVSVRVLHGMVQGNQAVMAVITVKGFHQRFDRNSLLLLTSDPRYFRYKGFKGYFAMMNALDQAIDDDFGDYPLGLGKRFVAARYPGGVVFENSTALDTSKRQINHLIHGYLNRSA